MQPLNIKFIYDDKTNEAIKLLDQVTDEVASVEVKSESERREKVHSLVELTKKRTKILSTAIPVGIEVQRETAN